MKNESGTALQQGIDLEKISGERGEPHTKTEENEMSEQQPGSEIDAGTQAGKYEIRCWRP
jgi:hypothetical protein